MASPGNLVAAIVRSMERLLGLRVRSARLLASLGFAVALSACQSYEPLALDTRPRLAASLAELRDSIAGGTLTVEDIALLAVENNPDLRAARQQRGVAQAEVLQAGLLPNPQISGSYGVLIGGPANFDAWSAGLSQDIKALLTLSSQRRGAGYAARKIDADLLWQEWQLVGKARLLAVDLIEGEALRRLLGETRTLFAQRYGRSRRALEQGNADLTTVSPDLTALSDIDKQIADADRQQLGRRHDLNALIGLAPDVQLPLADRVELPPVDAAAARRMLDDLPQRRPDLIALQLGYRAQEETVRGAILAQFPALILGGSYASDTSHVYTVGPTITLDLPIFNRNQGNIAIARATRQKLHDEFAARLTAANGEIGAMLSRQHLLETQIAAARRQLATSRRIADRAETAFTNGNIDERGYIDLTMTRIAKQQEIIAIEQLLLEQRVALTTVLGIGMPAVRLPELKVIE
jgi:outer membrane protein TolC